MALLLFTAAFAVAAGALGEAYSQNPTTNFRYTAIDSGAVTLKWNPVSGAEYYQIERDRTYGDLLLLSANNTVRTWVDYHAGEEDDVLTYVFKAYDSSWEIVDEHTIMATVPANAPPTVTTTDDKTKYGNERIRFTTAVTDEHVDRLFYEWTKTAGPSIDMTCITCDELSLKAPLVTAQTTFTFKVTVTDLSGDTASDTINLIVNPTPNTSPIADPGPDRKVNELETIGLYGLGSYDPDGTIDTYAWTQARGPTIQLEDDNTGTPKFTAPSVTQNTQFNYRLTVTDNDGETHSKMVRITVIDIQNKIPIVDAGSDQRKMAGSTVTLDATESYDEDNTVGGITYAWIQVSGPTVTLSASDVVKPTFTAPTSTSTQKLTFLLTVSDNLGGSAMDKVNIIVTTITRPVADAGDTILAHELGQVTLDGSGSTVDSNGNASYKWEIVEATSGFPDRLNGETVTFTTPEITADTVVVAYKLTITDNYLTSTDTVNVSVMNNIAPTSEIIVSEPGGENILSGETVILHGFAGDFNGADTITYDFDKISGPSITITETSNDKETSSETLKIVNEFTAPKVTTDTDLEFRLVVVDHAGEIATSNIIVTIVPNNKHLPVVDAGEDIRVDSGESVRIVGSVTDEDGADTVISEWFQISGTLVSIADATDPILEFTAPTVTQDTTLIFKLSGIDVDYVVEDSVIVIVEADIINVPLEVRTIPTDQTVSLGDSVTVESLGYDPDDDVTYSWTQVSGTSVSLTDSNKATASFTAPDSAGEIILRVAISSGTLTITHDVTITVQIHPEHTVGIEQDRFNANVGDSVRIEMTVTNPDGDHLWYDWRVAYYGDLNDVEISTLNQELDGDTKTASFTMPPIAQYDTLILMLVVSDGDHSDADFIYVTAN